MTALANATIEQVGALGAVTAMLVDVERTISSMQAVRDGLLAVGSRLAVEVAEQTASRDEADLALRAVAAEFAAALRVSDRTVQRRMTDATWRVEYFPLVWAAQGAGRISAGHARVICDAGEHLADAADREAYSAELIGFAETESPNRVARRARRVADCDIDHHHDAAFGGPTTESNLGHLCRRHHTLKHHTPWQVETLTDGLYTWTSPTGRTYIDRPPPPNTITFTEDNTAAPF